LNAVRPWGEESVWVCAAHEVSAIDSVYVISPTSGLPFRLGSLVIKTVADTAVISGETVATLRFSRPAEIIAMAAMGAFGEVWKDSNVSDQGWGNIRNWFTWVAGFGAGKDDWLRKPYQSGSPPPPSTEIPHVTLSSGSSNGFYVGSRRVGRFDDYTMTFRGYVLSGSPTTLTVRAGGPDGNIIWDADISSWGTDPDVNYSTALDTLTQWADIYFVELDTGSVGLYQFHQTVATDFTSVATDQYPSSATGTSDEDEDNVLELGGTIELDAGQYVEVTFPAATYDAMDLEINIYVSPTTRTPIFKVEVDGSQIFDYDASDYGAFYDDANEPFDIASPILGEVVRVTADAASDTFTISYIRRDIWTWDAFSLDRTVEIETPNFGGALQIYADVDGYKAPDASYKVASGTLMEHPADILHHWVAVIGGATIDTTTFDAAETNLGSDVWALDARGFGLTWEEIAAKLQFMARSNLLPEETASGQVWKLSQAESDYDWPAASGSITEWDTFVEAGRDLRELATRWLFPYAYDASKGTGDEAYTEVVVATPDQSDVPETTAAELVTAEALFGRFDAPPLPLLALRDETSAEEIAGYYVHEGIRLAALYAISGVPWWEGYALEVGDLVNVTPPWSDSSVKVRLIEVVKDFGTEQVDVRCVEVA
jgi:hypothetical protein